MKRKVILAILMVSLVCALYAANGRSISYNIIENQTNIEIISVKECFTGVEITYKDDQGGKGNITFRAQCYFIANEYTDKLGLSRDGRVWSEQEYANIPFIGTKTATIIIGNSSEITSINLSIIDD